MTVSIRLFFGTLLVLALAACGAIPDTTAPAGTNGTNQNAMAAMPTDMAGMNNDAMPTSMAGMDHSTMPTNSAVPYDAQFIDSMIMHHQGAVEMARQVQQEAQKPELKTLAQNIITAQQAEIEQLRQWRQAWYPGLAPTAGTGMAMGDMTISTDISKSFEERFIEAMTRHHQGAIDMAKDAQKRAEHSEIKTLAQNIITAQESEIKQMQQWQTEWYGK